MKKYINITQIIMLSFLNPVLLLMPVHALMFLCGGGKKLASYQLRFSGTKSEAVLQITDIMFKKCFELKCFREGTWYASTASFWLNLYN